MRVLGDFPSKNLKTVISLGDLEAAQRLTLDYLEPPVVIACDVARFGDDESIIATRFGRKIRIAEVLHGRDTMEVVGAIVRTVAEVKKPGVDFPTIVIDDVGVGGGVTDRLREVLAEKRSGTAQIRVVAFNGGHTALMDDEYPNRRSEVWFQFAEELPTVDLDDDEQLAEDLLSPEYKLDSKGRRVVEPKADTKKRLGRSPDRADAVLMTFAAGSPASAHPGWVDDSPRSRTGMRAGMSL